MAGVVSVPRAAQVTLRQIEFLPLSENRILVILVTNDREVQNRILHTDRDYSASELQQAQNFINEHYAGTDLQAVREHLLDDLEKTRNSMNQAMHDIIAVAHSAMDSAAHPDDEYVLAGETNLMDFAELSDIDTLRRLFDAFSRKRLILDLAGSQHQCRRRADFYRRGVGLRAFSMIAASSRRLTMSTTTRLACSA